MTPNRLPNIKHIIAIASGKGGVGKSTTAVNLALALKKISNVEVGLLDADIYGPSQPLMLGVTERPENQGKKLLPIIRHGIQSMSIGYLIDEKAPMVWRGPMVSMALQQLLNDTLWNNIEYLVIDLPPGTGDIQLTLTQKIPISGAVIVTTPQDLALLDAQRACEMFHKVNVPVLGVIENMSIHVCSQCGHQESIFGMGGGAHLAEQYHIELLGALPLDKRIREQTDQGQPTVSSDETSANAQLYFKIAEKLIAKLSDLITESPVVFPKIIIQND